MELCGIVEVKGVGFLYAILLAEHCDILALALDGEVAGKAYGIEHGEAVLVDVVLARGCYLADNGYLLVVETDDDNGVEQKFLLKDDVLDVLGHLVACLALDMDFAQCGEVDVTTLVNGVGKACLVVTAVVGCACEVEREGELLVLAVDMDGELVADFEPDVLWSGNSNALAVIQILEIGNFLLCCARCYNEEH